MRIARQQAQDLNRTHQFVSTLLSKDDVKNSDKPEGAEPPKLSLVTNGNASLARADAKNRFSDPPAPPPQQPLPEKPDMLPSALRRGNTERPKSHPSSASPTGPDSSLQLEHLQELLKEANRKIDTQSTRLSEMEAQLQKERVARETAEGELAKRTEEVPILPPMNGSTKLGADTLLEEAFEPPRDLPSVPDPDISMPDVDEDSLSEAETLNSSPDSAFQSRLDVMTLEMTSLRQQMEEWKQRCMKAETERDESRKTLAQMVEEIRATQAARAISDSKGRGRSRGRTGAGLDADELHVATTAPTATDGTVDSDKTATETSRRRDMTDAPTLSRQNTITPVSQAPSPLATTSTPPRDPALAAASVPYASILGVVLFGMGLMAYINGWQPQPAPGRP